MKHFLFILFSFFVTAANAKTWKVGASQTTGTIKEAVSRSTDGDTILIFPGIYKEGQLTITKRLFIKGVNYPVLDGETKTEIMTIRCNGVIVEFGLVARGRNIYSISRCGSTCRTCGNNSYFAIAHGRISCTCKINSIDGCIALDIANFPTIVVIV